MSSHGLNRPLVLALLTALALSGCDRNETSGNATAPGSPGAGNPAVTGAPVAARSQSGHPGMGIGGLGGSSGLGMTGSFPSSAPTASQAAGGR